MTTTRQRDTILYLFLGLLLLASAAAAQAPPRDVYVDFMNGSDRNDGSTWEQAKASIGAGLAVLDGAGTVHVAAGSYGENVLIEGGVWLLGGYPTGGGSRNPTLHPTAIQARERDSTVVIRAGTGVQAARIDGFRITGGIASYDPWAALGGNGGGIRQESGEAIIANNVITGNRAEWYVGTLEPMCPGALRCKTFCADTPSGMGAGIYIGPDSAGARIENNLINDNRIFQTFRSGACEPGCRNPAYAQPEWECDLSGVYTGPRAAGMGVYANSPSLFIGNNTIVENHYEERYRFLEIGADPSDMDLRGPRGHQWYCSMERNISTEILCLGGGACQAAYNMADAMRWHCEDPWMLTGDPLFVYPGQDGYQLSQIAAAQSEQSPAVDAGFLPAASVCIPGDPDRCMNAMTTRTDGLSDIGAVDLGYHYWGPDLPPPLPRLPEGFPRGSIRTPLLGSVDDLMPEGGEGEGPELPRL